MCKFPEILVLRHGQTEWNREGRHQGRLNSPLTSLGRSQARAQSGLLSGALGGRRAAAFCSPQGRAVDTAQIALVPLELNVIHDVRLREICFGKWQGLTFDQIADGWPELTKYADQDMFGWHFSAPGGEAFDDICARALAFLNELKGLSVIVTHGITSRILRGLWLGLGWDEMAAMPGGQGCVYQLANGEMKQIS
ncbi:MAG: histidine phosphatase family protein [Paracoccaceae bacterium]